MHRHKVTLPGRLSGITRVSNAATPPPPPQAPPPMAAPPAAPALAAVESAPASQEPDAHALPKVLAQLAGLVQEIQAQDRRTLGEVAQMSVDLGAAIAERLLGAAIAANRQRLDRMVLAALERMQASRSVVVRGHPDDLALLERQIGEHADLERYRDVLTFRRDEHFPRGQWKLEADDWFIEWDTQRSLAELRAALLEETFLDDA
jgi:flagellar biosynthesis/type III secretory pathway protein FliH